MTASAAALLTAAFALLALGGWLLRVNWMRAISPEFIPMVPNTAIGLVAGGLGLWLLRAEPVSRRRRAVAALPAALMGAIGILALLEHVVGAGHAIDRLLVAPEEVAQGILTRVSLNAALSLVLLAGSLLLLDTPRDASRSMRPAEVLAAIVATSSLIALASYVFGAAPYYSVPGRLAPSAVALNTAIALFVLSLGILAARAHRGVVAVLFEPLAGGFMAQRLLPLALCFPLLGVVIQAGLLRGYYRAPVAMALLAGLGAALGALVILSVGNTLNAMDRERKNVNERLASALDKQRQLYTEARAAVRTREDVVAVVSHDLRNPLNAMLSGAKLLSDQLIPRMDGELANKQRAQRAAQVVLRSGEIAQTLVADLLDFAKIEAGTLSLQSEPTPVGRILDEVVTLMMPLAERHSVELRIAPAPEMQIRCELRRVVQTLSNLVGNAIKFNRAGGHVLMTVREDPRGKAVFSVIDDGPGIDRATQEHLFERYWQPEKTRGQGTGLGLSIAKALVEAHGGTIWVESTPGHGSTFSFTLPTASLGSRPGPEPSHAPTR